MNNSDTYPEWPDGLGDPRVSAHGSHAPRAAINRHDVIAKFRADDTTTERNPVIPKKRPHLRQYEGIEFPPSRCSFHFHCRGALATKHCHSCTKFDESQQGYYCDACFTARHPAYRLSHSWTAIKGAGHSKDSVLDKMLTLLIPDATNQEEEWVAHITRHHLEQDAAELKLLLSETQAFLARSTSPKKIVQSSSTEESALPFSATPIDFKKTYTTASRIYGTLKGLIEQIHDQLEQKPPLTHEEALSRIQAMWKIRKARKQLKALVRDVYASFEDPTTGQTYYYNKYTKQTQWTKPVALGNEGLFDATARTTKKTIVVFASKEEEEQQAAGKLQAMARSHFARRHMRKLISSVYEKIWDANSQRFYYLNTKTKEVKWEKPRWVSDEDLLTPRTRYKQLQQESEEHSQTAHEYSIEKGKTVKERSAPWTPEVAACMVQRAYRRKKGFQNLLKMCRAVYERIYDPDQGLYYYHNTRTKETTWEKPLLLRGAESDVFTPRTRQKKLQSLVTAMNGKEPRKPRQWTEEGAATRLQGLYRAKKAKEELGARLVQRFKKAVDPSSGQVYYVNLLTQEVSWDPPALVLRSGVQIEAFED